jgi:hypothetical protein
MLSAADQRIERLEDAISLGHVFKTIAPDVIHRLARRRAPLVAELRSSI